MKNLNPKANISELFFSIQGEGPYVGTPHIFIRFFGCNIECRYCDTKTANYKTYSLEALKKNVLRLRKQYNARYLSLTGGEPLMQTDFLQEFLPQLCPRKEFIYLETNGILYNNFLKIRNWVDIISMDIKLPTAGGSGVFWPEHRKFLKLCTAKEVFVKTVITLSTKTADLEKAAELVRNVNRNITFVLQPDHNEWGEKLIKKCEKLQLIALRYVKDVRIIPQIHKIMGLR
ncbi:MAG: 7-carboxy-7-deazaguanine synthase QueE [Candidatus Omnitrophota bacterium]